MERELMTKIIRKHKKDCCALEAIRDGQWEKQGSLFFAGSEQFTRKGNKSTKRFGGDSKWFIFECNDPDCNAKIMVSLESIEDIICGEFVDDQL